jgi:hypothetical protein
MNIFILDKNPKIAAAMHCDKHVPKMILETAQMLSTAHRVYETAQAEGLYKQAHLNHPCTKWIRESGANYRWAWHLYVALLTEFTNRRGKSHKSGELIHELAHTPHGMPELGLTPFPQAMPDEYKHEDAVEAYRAYYMGDKAAFAKWEWPTAQTPRWWSEENSEKGLQSLETMV